MGGKHFRYPTFTCTGEVRGGLECAGRTHSPVLLELGVRGGKQQEITKDSRDAIQAKGRGSTEEFLS